MDRHGGTTMAGTYRMGQRVERGTNSTDRYGQGMNMVERGERI